MPESGRREKGEGKGDTRGIWENNRADLQTIE